MRSTRSISHPTLRAVVLDRQGWRCFRPSCPNPWTDLAHIEPSGLGGRPHLYRADNLVGLCRPCHRIFDGQDLAGRARMLRDLMAELLRYRTGEP